MLKDVHPSQYDPVERAKVMDSVGVTMAALYPNLGFVGPDIYHVAKEQVLAKFEKDYVTRLVARASGNMSRAARLASVDRTTLYRLLERHGFRRESAESQLA